MYTVMEHRSTVRDTKVRWQVGYAHDCGINEQTTRQYLHLRDNLTYPGVPVGEEMHGIKNNTSIGYEENPLEYNLNSLGKLRLRVGRTAGGMLLFVVCFYQEELEGWRWGVRRWRWRWSGRLGDQEELKVEVGR